MLTRVPLELILSDHKRWLETQGREGRCADLTNSDLRGTNLRDVNLIGAKLPAFQIPQEGTLTVWKRASGKELIKLEIPATAARTASLVGRKCRAEAATVLAIIHPYGTAVTKAYSRWDPAFVYRVGETVHPRSGYDPDIRVECAAGIHFFLTREEAETY